MDEVILLAESCLEVVYFSESHLRQFRACSKLWMKNKSVENGICFKQASKKENKELPLRKIP